MPPPPGVSPFFHFDLNLAYRIMDAWAGPLPNLRQILLYNPRTGDFCIVHQSPQGLQFEKRPRAVGTRLHNGRPGVVWSRARAVAFAADGYTPTWVYVSQDRDDQPTDHMCMIPWDGYPLSSTLE